MNVPKNEKLARFIFSKRHFSVEKNLVKYGAFMPPPDSEDLSVFRTSGLPDSEVWSIGREYVQGERRLRARGDLLTSAVYMNNLQVIPAPLPHELHANITPFPFNKHERDRIARKLASASQLKIKPPE